MFLRKGDYVKILMGSKHKTDKQFFKVQVATVFCEKIITSSVHSINADKVLTPADFQFLGSFKHNCASGLVRVYFQFISTY